MHQSVTTSNVHRNAAAPTPDQGVDENGNFSATTIEEDSQYDETTALNHHFQGMHATRGGYMINGDIVQNDQAMQVLRCRHVQCISDNGGFQVNGNMTEQMLRTIMQDERRDTERSRT